MTQTLGGVLRTQFLVVIVLGFVLVAQPAQAGWLSGTPLERIEHADGSTTYLWSAHPLSQCQWEGQQRIYTSVIRLVFQSGRFYFSWSIPRLFEMGQEATNPSPKDPAPELEPPPKKPEPEPEPQPADSAPESEDAEPQTEAAPKPPISDVEPELEPAPPQVSALNEWEQELWDLVNKERTTRGLKALEVDADLVNVARLKSQDMVDYNYFAHQSPTYGSPFDMMRSFGINYRMAGENLAAALSVASAHQALMNSPGHRANILNPDYTHVGVGIVAGHTYPMIVTQMFIAR